MRSGYRFIRATAGFTLVELLVVISIIALLLSILVPALGTARGAAFTVVCGTNLKSIGVAWLSFAADNNDYIPSPGTIGQTLMTQSDQELALDVGGSATQPTDWAGALAFDYMDINRPQRRDERFAILNGYDNDGGRSGGAAGVFGCPANFNISLPYDGSVQADGVSGTAFQPQVSMSYCASQYFTYWGNTRNPAPSWTRHPEYWSNDSGVMRASASWDQRLPGAPGASDPSSYTPRLDRIGAVLSNKFIMADGARYLDVSQTALDHDITARGAQGGSFADRGAWAITPSSSWASRAWPGGLNESRQDMTRLSFRHGASVAAGSSAQDGVASTTARGNVLKFDGSVETMNDGPASDFRRPDGWFPTGSTIGFSTINSLSQPFREEYQEQATGAQAYISRTRIN